MNDSKTLNEIKKEEMLSKLKKIFEYFCLYGERLNTNILKSNKFIKFANEAGMIDTNLNKTRLEIIYKSENKYNTMNFDQFLNCLIKIAEIKYQNTAIPISKTKCLNSLLHIHVDPLFNEIFNSENNVSMNGTTFNNRSTVLVPNIDEHVLNPNVEEIFTSVAEVFFDIYRVYFPHEISISENEEFVKEKSYKNFFLFIKDFDLCPGLVSKSAAFQIYKSEISNDTINNNKEYYFKIIRNIDLASIIKYDPKNQNVLGQSFNFFKFLRTLLKISEFGYMTQGGMPSHLDIPFTEKFILTLERMELSEGFLNLEKKTSRTHSSKKATIVKRDLLEKLNLQPNENAVIRCRESQINSSFSSMDAKNEFWYKNNYAELCEFSSYILEKYGQELYYIFKGICSFGDPLNVKHMRPKNFNKFLFDTKLISTKDHSSLLKVNLLDTIFIKLSNLNNYNSSGSTKFQGGNVINSNSRIDFNGFIIGIEIISRIIHPNLEVKEAIDNVIQNNIFTHIGDQYSLKFQECDKKIEFLKENQNNEEFVYVLGLVYKAFTPIYKYYAGRDNLIDFDNFMKFASDFTIFPDLVSKSKLNSFFRGVSQYSTYSNEETNIKIEQSLFVDMIALCSFEILFPDPDPTPIQKVISLCLCLGVVSY